MIDPTLFLAGIAASLVCIAVPGPDLLGSLAIGLSRGRAAGVAYATGVAAGCLTHTFFAVVGVAAIIAASPILFTALKWIGSAYLVYLGVTALWNSRAASVTSSVAINSVSKTDATQDALTFNSNVMKLFRQGFLSNVLNPKVMIFFIAFLPQFVDVKSVNHSPVWFQLLLQGLAFAVITGVSYAIIAMLADRVGRLLQRVPSIQTWLERASGMTFIAMGAWLALSDKK
jgi:threonine/homoserine/homoserine lactone efflux protein